MLMRGGWHQDAPGGDDDLLALKPGERVLRGAELAEHFARKRARRQAGNGQTAADATPGR
jgi:hypothetical protein